MRSFRNQKGATQQELGNRADVNYKFLGEIERGRHNPSFETLVKVAEALQVDPLELFRFEHEVANRKEAVTQIKRVTRQFVRHQANWFKENDPDIKWFQVSRGSVDDMEYVIRSWLRRNYSFQQKSCLK